MADCDVVPVLPISGKSSIGDDDSTNGSVFLPNVIPVSSGYDGKFCSGEGSGGGSGAATASFGAGSGCGTRSTSSSTPHVYTDKTASSSVQGTRMSNEDSHESLTITTPYGPINIDVLADGHAGDDVSNILMGTPTSIQKTIFMRTHQDNPDIPENYQFNSIGDMLADKLENVFKRFSKNLKDRTDLRKQHRIRRFYIRLVLQQTVHFFTKLLDEFISSGSTLVIAVTIPCMKRVFVYNLGDSQAVLYDKRTSKIANKCIYRYDLETRALLNRVRDETQHSYLSKTQRDELMTFLEEHINRFEGDIQQNLPEDHPYRLCETRIHQVCKPMVNRSAFENRGFYKTPKSKAEVNWKLATFRDDPFHEAQIEFLLLNLRGGSIYDGGSDRRGGSLLLPKPRSQYRVGNIMCSRGIGDKIPLDCGSSTLSTGTFYEWDVSDGMDNFMLLLCCDGLPERGAIPLDQVLELARNPAGVICDLVNKCLIMRCFRQIAAKKRFSCKYNTLNPIDEKAPPCDKGCARCYSQSQLPHFGPSGYGMKNLVGAHPSASVQEHLLPIKKAMYPEDTMQDRLLKLPLGLSFGSTEDIFWRKVWFKNYKQLCNLFPEDLDAPVLDFTNYLEKGDLSSFADFLPIVAIVMGSSDNITTILRTWDAEYDECQTDFEEATEQFGWCDSCYSKTPSTKCCSICSVYSGGKVYINKKCGCRMCFDCMGGSSKKANEFIAAQKIQALWRGVSTRKNLEIVQPCPVHIQADLPNLDPAMSVVYCDLDICCKSSSAKSQSAKSQSAKTSVTDET